ncbi:hypothetical protein L249_8812 [Ophiocordyceps polyrhachis-furcata BCC 54312]|uniref:Peptidase M60 domain-containing protein n=1 Tax=Ophiocordyceps polyrhachis-furcata BCC 54312 TaxID=1330021 RepID=A0A367L1L5_9HYPO|nr:hypothetical protein L249_8812 [Ophiocordyceps polyrhachis-furcata BCC 54312]
MIHPRVSLLLLGNLLVSSVVVVVIKAEYASNAAAEQAEAEDAQPRDGNNNTKVAKASVGMEIYQQARSLHQQEEQPFWIRVMNKGPAEATRLVLASPKLSDFSLLITEVGNSCLQTDVGSDRIYCEWRNVRASLQKQFGMSVKYYGSLRVKDIMVPLTLTSYLHDDKPMVSSASVYSLYWQVHSPQVFEYDSDSDYFFPQERAMEISALPRAADEMSRLRQWFQWSDLQPTGFYHRPGTPLEVLVEGVSTEGPRPELVIGTPELVDPRNRSDEFLPDGQRSKQLEFGFNEVICPTGGIIYIRYTYGLGTGPPPPITVTLGEGMAAQPFPLFRQGLTTEDEWRKMLMVTQVPFAELAGRRVIVTGLASHAMRYALMGQEQEDLLETYEKILAAQDRISGLFRHGTSAEHRPSPLRPMIVQSPNSRSGNSYHFRAAIPTMYHEDVWWKPALQKSWMVWHELGHQRQQVFAWSWDELGETTANIYSLAAQRMWRNRSGKHGSSEEWMRAKEFLAAWRVNRTVDFDMTDDFVRLAMFEQLRVIFGDGFYHALHAMARESPPRRTTDEKKLFFMSRASSIAKLNLRDYFEKWGLRPQPTAVEWMARFPTPVEDLTERPVYTSRSTYYV